MCFILLLRRMHPDYPLIVAANRDERRDRPSSGPQQWEGRPVIWAGRDEVAGGTWLGVNEHGMVAAITNRQGGVADPKLPSRGTLCLDTLRQQSPASARTYVSEAVGRAAYNPFNLVCTDRREGWVMTSGGSVHHLAAGPHVVTNHGDADDPSLPEVQRALADLTAGSVWTLRLEEILAMLAQICRDTREPNPICRAGGDRGTVSSSMIAVRVDGSLAAYWHAEGPPCDPAHEYRPLDFRETAPRSQKTIG